MADTLGALALPAPAPVGTAAAGDPALTKLGAFLHGSLNRALALPWAAVCPGRDAVEHVFCHDPQTLFDEGRLPALYLWRTGWDSSEATDDTLRRNSTISIWWITEPASNEILALREPILNAADAAIVAAVRRGFDPGWVDEGDTDTSAATRGSVLRARAGISIVGVGRSTPLGRQLYFEDSDGKQVPIPGLATSLVVSEDLVRSRSDFHDTTAMHTDYSLASSVPFATGEDAQPPEAT